MIFWGDKVFNSKSFLSIFIESETEPPRMLIYHHTKNEVNPTYGVGRVRLHTRHTQTHRPVMAIIV